MIRGGLGNFLLAVCKELMNEESGMEGREWVEVKR